MRDVARIAPTFFVPGIATFISAPILFATLGADNYGVLALGLAIAIGVPQLTSSWAESTIIRFGHVRRPSRMSEVLSLLLSGLAGMLAAALVLGDEPPILWIEVGALTASVGAYVLRAAHFQSMMRFSAVSRLAAYRAIVGSALAVILGLVAGGPDGAIIGFAIGFAAVTAVTSRGHGQRQDAGPAAMASDEFKPRAFGIASMGVAISLYVLTAGDRFVLNAFRPLDEVGVYAISYTLTEMVMRLMPSVLLVVIRPRVFRSWDLAEAGTAYALIGDAIALLLWAMAWAQIAWLIVVQSAGMSVVELHIAGPVSIGITSLSVAFAISLLLTARLDQARLAMSTMACAALAIAADIVVLPSHGAVGAALVTAGAYSVLMLLHWAGSGLRFARRNAVLAVAAFLSIVVNGLMTLSGSALPALVIGAAALVALAPAAVRIARSLIVGSTSRAW